MAEGFGLFEFMECTEDHRATIESYYEDVTITRPFEPQGDGAIPRALFGVGNPSTQLPHCDSLSRLPYLFFRFTPCLPPLISNSKGGLLRDSPTRMAQSSASRSDIPAVKLQQAAVVAPSAGFLCYTSMFPAFSS
jgi:hypothetical protein